MQNIYSDYKKTLENMLQLEGFNDLSGIRLQPPNISKHGDMATNAALVLGKKCGQNPKILAEKFARLIEKFAGVERVEIAGAGFVNLFLKAEIWQAQVKTILELGRDYAKSNIGCGQKVNIEYVSANPTGPLHIGHARGAVFGDVLAALMENAGYEVVREYYVNDEGTQIDILAKSLLMRIKGKEVPEGFYPGEYLIKIAEEIDKEILELEKNERHKILRKKAVEAMIGLIKNELGRLNINHDVFVFESALHGENKILSAVGFLKDRGLIYQGTLPPPKGKDFEDWEEEEQLLFRSLEFGDDSDRTVKKSNGDYTYFASDIAYHYDKISRKFNHLINIFGADHGGYTKRLKAVVKALSDNKTTLDICLMHLVRVVRNGTTEMMSKRKGNFISLKDLLDQIGADALRFIMLTRKNDAPLDIDIELLKQQSNDNPVFYVQYAHARCCSVIANSGLAESEILKTGIDDLSCLNNEAELALIKLLSQYPGEIAQAALDKAPHRLAFYLQSLAASFHALWNLGSSDESLKFITQNDNIKRARLGLVCATGQVLNSGLRLMGVEPKRELR